SSELSQSLRLDRATSLGLCREFTRLDDYLLKLLRRPLRLDNLGASHEILLLLNGKRSYSSMRLGLGIGLLCVCGAALLSVGCGGGGGQAKLRVLNASPNEGTINVLVDSNTIASSISYASTTDYVSLNSGSRHLQVEPTNSTTAAIDTTLNLASDS